jgi:hypothetical protein
MILPVVFYDEFLWVFESGMSSKTMTPKRKKIGQNCIMKNSINCSLPKHHQNDSIEEGYMMGHAVCMGEIRNTQQF